MHSILVSELNCCSIPELLVLGSQRILKIDKENEMDMPNVNPMRILANSTIFHQLMLGFTLGWLGFVFGPRGPLDTNLLVSVIRNAHAWG